MSRITPIFKPNNPTNLIQSFCPINNLISLDKVFEQYLLTNLTNFLQKHDIVHDNNHGDRAGYSTTTTLVQINNTLQQNLDKDRITAVISTDLTAAYDTVDRDILVQKLDHYGIRGFCFPCSSTPGLDN